MTDLPVPEPKQDPGAQAYWSAAAAGELTVARCKQCDRFIWYPRSRCPACMSSELEIAAVSGDGVVYSYTVNRRPAGLYKGLDAVVLAYVELAEGPRILTNIVGIDPTDIRIGTAVRAVYAKSPEGAGVLRFGPR